MSKTITIIDTFGFFFRSFYALPPLSTSDGFPTGLLTGFTNFIATLHKEHSSDYLVFALDSKGPSFRNEIDENYKANREAPPEELVKQLPIAIEWIEKMGFMSMAKEGFEADDIVASLTIEAKKIGLNVRVVSHDKDLYQLIDDDKVVLYDAIKRKQINEAACFKKYGIHPYQFTDYQALLGDSADNVPGVKGIGKVTAQKLLTQYETLDNIYENIDEVSTARTQKLLREGKQDAYRSKELVTLRQDIYSSIDFESMRMHDNNPFITLYDEMKRYEMNAIVRMLEAKGLVESHQEEEVSTKLPFEPILVQDSHTLHAIIDVLPKNAIIAFDTETTGLDAKVDSLVGFSFASSKDKAYYVPLTHHYLGVGHQITIDEAKEAVQRLFMFEIVGHNIKFDLHFITASLGIAPPQKLHDTIVMAWLLDPQMRLNLDHLMNFYQTYKMADFKSTLGKAKTFSEVDLNAATLYAAEDAWATLTLYETLLPLISASGLQSVLKEVEEPFILTLFAMEEEGILLDAAYLGAFKVEVAKELEQIKATIYDCAGGEFNINSTKQLGALLFETLKLPVGKKTKTGYSTDEKVLQSLKGTHAIIEPLLQYRELYKLFSTYIEPLLELYKQQPRIHTTYSQTATATGRLNSKNPNLQNIPTKTEMGTRIRRAFIAKEGYTFIGIDYSQIELRLLAHFSKDAVLLKAFLDDEDIHHATAVSLFGESEAATKRHIAKTVNFGLLYGMGAKRLSQTLSIELKEAKEIITKYFESFPTVKGYFQSIVQMSKEQGYVETLLGRKRLFNYEKATPMQKAAFERESVNTVFQGSAADLIKMAMIEIQSVIKVNNLDAKMLLQIHDELIFEVPQGEAKLLAKRFQTIMQEIQTLNVPLKTSLNIASSWDQLK